MPLIEEAKSEEKDVVLTRGEPKAEPKEDEEISDEIVRKVLKAKFGEDDPAAFNERLERVKQVEALIPAYQQTVEDLSSRVRQFEERPRPSATPKSPEEEEEFLKDLFVRDPWKALDLMRKRDKIEMAKMAAMAESRGFQRAQGVLESKDYGTKLRQEWPEAYDENHELAQTAARIFHNEMSDAERRSPSGFYAAAERAAGRLGIPPKTRRTPREPAPVRDLQEFASQNVSRGSTKTKDTSSSSSDLTAQDRKRIAMMGIDEKTFRLARDNRKAGKNIRVEDK